MRPRTTCSALRTRTSLAVAPVTSASPASALARARSKAAWVATAFRYQAFHSLAQESNYNVIATRNNIDRRYSVGNNEGGNGLNFATAGDPRVPVCVGGDAACRAINVTNTQRDDLGRPFHVQMIWPTRESAVTLVSGVEARLIEAEAQLRAGNNEGSLATLNALRTTVPGLAPLTQAATAAGAVDQLFRERAFWNFSRGHRVGDLRRLIRQYGRAANTVFPTGTWHKNDAQYGGDVTIPVPTAEQNNPNTQGADICLNRAA